MNRGIIPIGGSLAGLALTFGGIKLKFKREGKEEAILKTVLVQCFKWGKQYSI